MVENKMAEWRPVSVFHIYFNIKGIKLKEQMTFENFTIESYNIRGLTDKLKKVQLRKDLKFYNVDVCYVQETKITEDIDTNIRDCQLISQKTNQKDYGISNTQKIRTAYAQSMETKWQIIDPGNANETTLCMYTKWESKNNHKKPIKKRREVHIYPKRYKTENTENTREIFTENS